MPRRRRNHNVIFDPANTPITARKDALASGAVRYFTGVPCSAGHIVQRYTSNGGCVACVNPIPTYLADSQHQMVFTVTLDGTPMSAEHAVKLRELVDAWVHHVRREWGYEA